jgi:SAM-dependent methyltransferase
MFDQYARFYDLCNADKDYAKEADFIAGLIRSRRPEAKDLLDLGSGTGTHALLLAQLGFRVTGVELSPGMAEIARRKPSRGGAPVEFLVADVRTLRLDRTFDAVTSLFHVMSYQVSNEDFASALGTARAHLRAGGIFIFDFWYGPAVLADRPEVRTKRIEREGLHITRRAEPEHDEKSRTVNVNYTLQVLESGSASSREIRESHRMRYYFLPEIMPMLDAAGFRVLAAHGWLDKAPLSDKTWGACLTAEAC